MTFEYEGRGRWHLGEINPLPQAPLHSVLRWILDHLNAGCARFVGDGGDDPPAHTVVLGQGASSYVSAEEAVQEVQKRGLAVSIAGGFATARERGVEPEHEGLAKKAKGLANENGKMNTDFHYAYELVEILERISNKTFVFDAPPIVGRAEPQTLDLLQEATRCYLFGLHRACVAICRTVLEDSLEQRVPRGKAGNLERLIDAAVCAGVLPTELSDEAHNIRKQANAVLHKPARGDVPDPWKLLLDTRRIVGEVHTRPRRPGSA